MRRFSVLIGLLVLAPGCDGGAAKGVTGNWANTATLAGDPVGLGSEPADQLTRIIPAQISGAGITGNLAILGRTTTTWTDYRFLAEVTNHGTRRQCLLVSGTFEFLSAAGAVLGKHPEEWVKGSVGKLKDNGTSTDTCLDVGETGYLLGLTDGTKLEDIASVRIVMSASPSEWVAPTTSVVPIAYRAPARDQEFTVTIANQGAAAARISSMSTVVFFDDAGTPAYWDFLLPGTMTQSTPHDLAPGQTDVLNSNGGSLNWTGTSNRLWVSVNFTGLTTTPDLRMVPTADVQAATALQARQRAIQEKLAPSVSL